MYRIEDSNLSLVTEIALCDDSDKWYKKVSCQATHKKHVYGYLLPFVLEVVDVSTRNALGCVGQNAFKWIKLLFLWIIYHIPASVRFPLLVKLVLRAPVPAYILESASPFSAHNSRWDDHNWIEANHSRRTRARYCSRVVFDKISWTKLVRSKLYTINN